MKQLGLLLLLSVGLAGWRIWGWWAFATATKTGAVVHWTVILTEPVSAGEYSCLFSYRGMLIEVKQSLCNLANLRVATGGDTVIVTGSWHWWDESHTKGAIMASQVQLISQKRWRGIAIWRERLIRVFQASMPEPEAGLVAGIVVGADGHFSEAFTAILQRTGTMHMVAASGYNVAIVIGFLMPLLVWAWGRRLGSVATGGLVWGYVLLAGSSPSVVRAGLMGIGLLLAQAVGRLYWAGWILLLVVTGMITVSPWFVMDISFQLSVWATVGVLLGIKPKQIPANKNITIWKKVYYSLTESLMTTMAAVIMTAPISLWHFNQVSWWGIVVNPLVLWLVPPLTYLGLVMAIMGIIWLPLAQGLAWMVEPLAMVMIWLLKVASLVPFDVLTVRINIWMMVGWWLFWVGIMSWKRSKVDL